MNTAVVLAAGRGGKMWPYGEIRPKVLVPVANKPLLLHNVEMLKNAGFQRIIVVTGYRGEQIRALFGDDPGVELIHAADSSGNADSLARALPAAGETAFLAMHGDLLISPDNIEALLEFHRAHPAENAVMVAPLAGERPQDWHCVDVEGKKVAAVLGHPRDGVTHRLAGVYLFTPDIAGTIINHPGQITEVQVGMMPPVECDLIAVLGAWLRKGGSLSAVDTGGYYLDLDKPWHLLEANRIMAARRAAEITEERMVADGGFIDPSAKIEGRVQVGENSRIGAGVMVRGNLRVGRNTVIDNGAMINGDTVIGDDVTITDYACVAGSSVIGDRCVLRCGAEVEGVLMENVYLYHYMLFWGVIGACTDLGAATVCGTLRFDDLETLHRVGGRRQEAGLFANAVYLGDYCRTGVSAILMPGAKTGPYSVVGPGVILKGDLPGRTLITVKQELKRETWGPERYGW